MRKVRLKGRKIPRVLYHWSPHRRRPLVQRHGLRINRLSNDREWRPPYLCFSDCPARALMLCPHIPKGTMLDLYEVFPLLKHKVYRLHRDRQRRLIPEWRIYNNVPKSRIFFIASRKQTGHRLPTL